MQSSQLLMEEARDSTTLDEIIIPFCIELIINKFTYISKLNISPDFIWRVYIENACMFISYHIKQ